MQKLDLKASLLLGINEIIPIVRYKRLTINRQSYSIKYVIKGQMLVVHNIKRIVKRNTLVSSLKLKKCNFVRRMMRMRKEALQKIQYKQVISVEVQTITKDMHEACVETMPIYKTNKWSNTRLIGSVQQSSQTEIKSTNVSTQCCVPLENNSSQTAISTSDIGIQKGIECANKECQITTMELLNVEELQAEYLKVVILLNELSKMLLTQNHLLSNNSTLLGQLSELSIHNKVAQRQKLYMHCLKKLQKRNWARQYTRMCGKRRYVFRVKTPPKAGRSVQCSTVEQQTDPMNMKTKSTQTLNETSKSKIFPGFFKTSNGISRSQKVK